MFIKNIGAKLIKNSRGEKTIEICLKTYHGKFYASPPSGKSKGKNEVPDYNVHGIKQSRKLFAIFCKKMTHKNIIIDTFEDLKTVEDSVKVFEKEYGKLGGNVVFALESAFLKAAAKEKKKEVWQLIFDGKNAKMPMPVGNCVGGGLHSRGIGGKKPDFQEFLLIPHETKFSRAVTKNIHAYFYVKSAMKKINKTFFEKTNDEHACETSMTNEQTLDFMRKVSERFDIGIGLDVASSSFYNKMGYYQYQNKELIRDRIEQIDYMRRLVERYNLVYVEDPISEEDFSGFKELMAKIKKKDTMIVGDDLTTTNLHRTERANRANAINAMIIKPNQIGSLIEVKRVVEFCKKNKIKTIFSHRSGETMDYILADLAFGFQADYIKTGIYGRERLIKLKRLIDIEKKLERVKAI